MKLFSIAPLVRILFVLSALSIFSNCGLVDSPHGSKPNSNAKQIPLTAKSHAFIDSGGQSQRVLQYFAQGEPKQQSVVIYFGGAWKKGAAYTMEPFCRGFVQAGYHCFAPSYRTSEYHGTGVEEAMHDAKTTFSWIQENSSRFGIDPQGIWSAGLSAGGLLAAWQKSRGHFLWVPVLKTHGPSSYSSDLLNPEYAQEIDVLMNLNVSIEPKPSYVFTPLWDNKVPLEGSLEYCQLLKSSGVECQKFQVDQIGHEVFTDYPHLLDSTVAHAVQVMDMI